MSFLSPDCSRTRLTTPLATADEPTSIESCRCNSHTLYGHEHVNLENRQLVYYASSLPFRTCLICKCSILLLNIQEIDCIAERTMKIDIIL